HAAAGNIARADHQVGPGVDRVEHRRQALGRVAAVGVHLHEDRVPAVEPPPEPGDVGGPQTFLARAVQDTDPTAGVLGREAIGDLAGPVGTVVVRHEYGHVRGGGEQPFHHRGEVLPLVV